MSAVTLGATAAPFALTEPATGKTVARDDFAALPALVVVFTCNHCPYAQAWEERLNAIGRDYAGRAGMVLINANDAEKYPADGPAAMAARAREHDFSVPYLHDADQTVARAYGAERTPEVFVYDGERRLAYHGTVDDNYEEPAQVTEHYARAALDAVLAGRPVARPETQVRGCTIKWKP
jgi:peroxiredoxin